MKIKRTLSILLSVILLFSMAVPALAAETKQENIDILRETVYQSEYGYSKLSETDSFVMMKTKRKMVSDIVGARSYYENAKVSQTYENECIIFIPCSDNTSHEIYDILSSSLSRSVQNGSHEITEADDYGCARFTLKINYTVELKDDGFTYYDLISVSGGFYDAYTTGSYVGENVYVRAHSVEFFQHGKDYYSDNVENSETYSINVNSRNWSYTVPSSWRPIGDGDIFAQAGARYSFTLGRGSSTWSKTIGVGAI